MLPNDHTSPGESRETSSPSGLGLRASVLLKSFPWKPPRGLSTDRGPLSSPGELLCAQSAGDWGCRVQGRDLAPELGSLPSRVSLPHRLQRRKSTEGGIIV